MRQISSTKLGGHKIIKRKNFNPKKIELLVSKGLMLLSHYLAHNYGSNHPPPTKDSDKSVPASNLSR